MATQGYQTEAQRIGKYKGQILGHAMPQEVAGRFGVKKEIPKNSGDTVVFRRWLPHGATTSAPNIWNVDPAKHTIQDGVTPVADTIKPQDIQATLQEYGVVYRYTNRAADLYEDDVPAEIIQLAGERMGLVLELVRLGVLRACTNAFYPGGVNSRGSVASKITPTVLRKVARSQNSNLARRITKVLDASPKFNTYPIEAAYVVLCHSDCEADLRTELPGFKHVSEYGQRQALHVGPQLLLEAWGPDTPARPRRSIDWAALGAWAQARWQQPLTVADLAKQVFLSPTQFATRCRSETGHSAMQWLRGQRLAHAQQLRAAGLGVTETAQRCGYRSPSALTAALRRDFQRP